MASQLKLRRGSSLEHDSFTGAEGEVTVDTTLNTLRVHDGVTVGGEVILRDADLANYMEKAQNLSDVQDVNLSRINLGLGTAAQLDVGTLGTEVRNNTQNDGRFTQRSNNLSDLDSIPVARDTLQVLQSGTADAQVRTNLQNDGRFAQLDGGNWGDDGLGGYGYGGANAVVTQSTIKPNGFYAYPQNDSPWGASARFISIGTSEDNGVEIGVATSADRMFARRLGGQPFEAWTDANLPDPVTQSGDQVISGAKRFSDRWRVGSDAQGMNGVVASSVGGVLITYGYTTNVRIDLDAVNNRLRVRNNLQVDENLTVGGTINGGALPNGAGEVGTYAFARRQSTFVDTNFGFTAPGSELRPSDHTGAVAVSTLSGTWRCMGYVEGTSGSTSWIRIS